MNLSQAAMREAIQRVAVGPDRGRDIDQADAQQVMTGILEGQIDDVQVAVFLIALRMKRESMGEFLGLFEALADYVEAAKANVPELFCLADPFDGYSRTVTITPFMPPVLSACGLPTLMHGVQSVGPKHGVTAHKVYQLAGMDTHQSTAEVVNSLEQHACGYIDQSQYAPALYALQSLRDRMVKRTALTTLERLLMPIQGQLKTHLVLGYVHKAYPEIYASVASLAGYDTTLLVKGVEGGLAPALNKPLRRFFFTQHLPNSITDEKQVIESSGLFDAPSAALSVVDGENHVARCLDVGLAVLNGEPGLARDSLCLAVGQILFAHDATISLSAAVEKVRHSLDNGSAKERFLAMVGDLN